MPQVHLRLVVQRDGPTVDGPGQAGLDQAVALQLSAQPLVVPAHRGAAGLLDAVQSSIGTDEQLLHGGGVLGEARHPGADAHRNRADLRLHPERAQPTGQRLAHGGRGLLGTDLHEGNELVARAAAQQMAGGQPRAQMLGQADDDGVAHVVAVAVVHPLQVVHVEEDHEKRLLQGIGRRQSRLQGLAQAAEVRQSGEAVVVRQETQLVLGRLDGADVGDDCHGAMARFGGVLQARYRHPGRDAAPVTREEGGLAAPDVTGHQRAPDVARDTARLRALVQQARGLAQQLLPREAGHELQRRVHVGNMALAIGDQDGLGRGVEDAGRGAQRFGVLLLLAQHAVQGLEHGGNLVVDRVVLHGHGPAGHDVRAVGHQLLQAAGSACGKALRPALELRHQPQPQHARERGQAQREPEHGPHAAADQEPQFHPQGVLASTQKLAGTQQPCG